MEPAIVQRFTGGVRAMQSASRCLRLPVTFFVLLHSNGITCTHAHAVDHSKQKRPPKSIHNIQKSIKD